MYLYLFCDIFQLSFNLFYTRKIILYLVNYMISASYLCLVFLHYPCPPIWKLVSIRSYFSSIISYYSWFFLLLFCSYHPSIRQFLSYACVCVCVCVCVRERERMSVGLKSLSTEIIISRIGKK